MTTTPTTSLEVRTTRTLACTPEQAWAGFTDPTARAEWYREQPDDVVVTESDLRVGGAWSVQFGPFREEGVYEVVDPPHRLVTPVRFVHPNGDSFTTTLSVTFTAVEGGTLFELVDAGFPNERVRDAHQRGWPMFLDRLEAVIASAL